MSPIDHESRFSHDGKDPTIWVRQIPCHVPKTPILQQPRRMLPPPSKGTHAPYTNHCSQLCNISGVPFPHAFFEFDLAKRLIPEFSPNFPPLFL